MAAATPSPPPSSRAMCSTPPQTYLGSASLWHLHRPLGPVPLVSSPSAEPNTNRHFSHFISFHAASSTAEVPAWITFQCRMQGKCLSHVTKQQQHHDKCHIFICTYMAALAQFLKGHAAAGTCDKVGMDDGNGCLNPTPSNPAVGRKDPSCPVCGGMLTLELGLVRA